MGRPQSAETRRKIGEANRGKNNGNWNGGRTIDGGGYVRIKRPEHPYAESRGYVLEHRLVMEGVLGRYLKRNEFVHHKNGDRADNRRENLELVIRRNHRGELRCPNCDHLFNTA